MDKKTLVEYKRQLTQLKELKELKNQENNKEQGMVKKIGTHPILNANSKNLFVKDERGYLSAILLGGLVFAFEIGFLALSYFIFKI